MSLRASIIALYRKAGGDRALLSAAEGVQKAHEQLEAHETGSGITPFFDGVDAEAFEHASDALVRIQDKIKASALPVSKTMRDDFEFLATFIFKSLATANRLWVNGPDLERMVNEVAERIPQQQSPVVQPPN